MEYYAPYRVARQFKEVHDIVGDIPLYLWITQEVGLWGQTVSPLKGSTGFQTTTYLVWDEWRGVGEDLGTTRGYMSWWEAHLPVQLTILGVLEDDEVKPTMDEIVIREEDAPGDRVLA